MTNPEPSPHSPAQHPGINADGLPANYVFRPEFEVTARATKAAMDRGTPPVLLVDVRTREEWDLVHVDGAVHLPLDQVERRWTELDVEPGQAVCVICHHGVRSLKATLALRQLGIPNAMSVAGGIEAWSLAADPTVRRYERGPAGSRLIP